MWLERIRWWLWRRRRALKSQREENEILEDAVKQARMRELLFRPDTNVGWVKKHYAAGLGPNDPGQCYEMRSVAELLGE